MQAPARGAPWLDCDVVGEVVGKEVSVEDDDLSAATVERREKRAVPFFGEAVGQADERARRAKIAAREPFGGDDFRLLRVAGPAVSGRAPRRRRKACTARVVKRRWLLESGLTPM